MRRKPCGCWQRKCDVVWKKQGNGAPGNGAPLTVGWWHTFFRWWMEISVNSTWLDKLYLQILQTRSDMKMLRLFVQSSICQKKFWLAPKIHSGAVSPGASRYEAFFLWMDHDGPIQRFSQLDESGDEAASSPVAPKLRSGTWLSCRRSHCYLY